MRLPSMVLRRRITGLLLFACLFIVVLIGRLGWIQLVQGEQLRAEALELRMRDMQVEARRGTIFDREGRELAISVNVDSIYAIPAEIRDPQPVAAALSEVLEISYEDMLERVTRQSSFVWIQRKVDDERSRRVRALDLPGVHFTVESRRYYPKGSLASHVLGFSGIDNQGLEGVELVYDEPLSGKAGRIVSEFDARGREIPEAVHYFISPEEGKHLVLTLDEVVQHVAERELEAAVTEHEAKGGLVLIMHPPTGDILAMASYPGYDLNRWSEYPSNQWRNPIVSNSFHPGSVFKPFIAASAIDSGICTPDTGFYDPGSIQVPGAVIRNWDGAGLGSTTLSDGIRLSSNVVLSQTALKLGTDRVYQYLHTFGFGGPTAIDLPGEAAGLLPPQEEARPVDLAVMSFGQTLQATAVQMVAAMNTFLTGGELIQPRIARGLVDDDGDWIEEFPVKRVRQAIAPDTAAQMKDMLVNVVENGTGANAQMPGYTVGGKTGTSQKTVAGRVAEDVYLGSFMGFLPAHDPQLLIYIVIDEPAGMPFGGWTSAPAFTRMARDLVYYLDIPPDVIEDDDDQETPAPPEAEKVAVPSVVNLPLSEARDVLEDLGLAVSTEGEDHDEDLPVLGQVPPPGVEVEPGSTVVLSLSIPPGPAGQDQVTAPDLHGLSLRRAAEVLAIQGLKMSFSGTGLVEHQDPEPGTTIRRGSTVHLELSPSPEGQ